jgi:hypothetical protein
MLRCVAGKRETPERSRAFHKDLAPGSFCDFASFGTENYSPVLTPTWF